RGRGGERRDGPGGAYRRGGGGGAPPAARAAPREPATGWGGAEPLPVVAADGYQPLAGPRRGIRHTLDRLPRARQREAVREERGDRFLMGLHQPDPGAEIRRGGAARPDDVDLLLGENTRAQGTGRRGHPPHDNPPRRR